MTIVFELKKAVDSFGFSFENEISIAEKLSTLDETFRNDRRFYDKLWVRSLQNFKAIENQISNCLPETIPFELRHVYTEKKNKNFLRNFRSSVIEKINVPLKYRNIQKAAKIDLISSIISLICVFNNDNFLIRNQFIQIDSNLNMKESIHWLSSTHER